MATQSTSSRKKPAAKANVANEHLIDRLRHIKAQPIDRKVLAAIVGKQTLTAKEATEMEKQIHALLADAERVQRTRRDLEQAPSIIQRGSVLL